MRKLLAVVALLAFAVSLAAMKEIIVDINHCLDFAGKIEENGGFIGIALDVDVDDEGNIYFLSGKSKSIFKVDYKTGKVLREISSFGQGPGDLHTPSTMCVRNKFIFVCDTGFGGVKIFDLNGKPLKQFRTSSEIRNLDVSTSMEIYVTETDGQLNPCINVYNMDGKKIRQALFIKIPNVNDKIEFIKMRESCFRVDNNGNLLLLFIFTATLKKYNSTGVLLWEKKIDNPLIRELNREISVRRGINGTVRAATYIRSSFEIDGANNVVISHGKGGMIYNKEGVPLCCIRVIPDKSLGVTKVVDNGKKLLFCLPGGAINIVDYQKLIQ